MRRYARALGTIKSRTVEKNELIGVVSSEAAQAVLNNTTAGASQTYERLRYADLDVEGEAGSVVLAYKADEKDFVSLLCLAVLGMISLTSRKCRWKGYSDLSCSS